MTNFIQSTVAAAITASAAAGLFEIHVENQRRDLSPESPGFPLYKIGTNLLNRFRSSNFDLSEVAIGTIGYCLKGTGRIIHIFNEALALGTDNQIREATDRLHETNSTLNATLDEVEQVLSPEAEELLSMVELARDISQENYPLMDKERKAAFRDALDQLDKSLSDSIPEKIEIIVKMVSEFLKSPETQSAIKARKDQETLYQLAISKREGQQAKLAALDHREEQAKQSLAETIKTVTKTKQAFAKSTQSLAKTVKNYEVCDAQLNALQMEAS